MMHFTVEDYSAIDATCQKCCCQKLNLKPGTTTKVSVGYAPWAVPIGQLHCSPQFQIEQMDTCPVPVGINLPPQVVGGAARFGTNINTHLDGDMKTAVTDPEAAPMTFKLLSLYGPKYGKLVLDASGVFDYTPSQDFSGEDRFYVSASDGANTVIFETIITVGTSDPLLAVATPHISIGPATVDSRYFTASFPVTVSPAASECEVWRLTVLQTAMDCNCTCFSRTDCFDIGIVKC